MRKPPLSSQRSTHMFNARALLHVRWYACPEDEDI